MEYAVIFSRQEPHRIMARFEYKNHAGLFADAINKRLQANGDPKTTLAYVRHESELVAGTRMGGK